MPHAPEALILDLVEWIARRPRAYDDVMDAWRTSCPRLPVWEDAVARGLVERRREGFDGPHGLVTPAGRDFLAMNRRGDRSAA